MRRATLAALVLAAACTSSTEPAPGSTVRRPATLEHFDDLANMVAPASANVNVPFDVQFTTYGGGCISRATAEVEVAGLEVRIRAFQDEYIPRANEACTDELRVEQNVVRVSITSSGTATVRVFGRKMPGSSDLVLVRLVSVDP